MARPQKDGIDYFSIDCDFFQNRKVRKLKLACGPNAISVLVCLLCNIYRNKGYYILWDEDLPFLIADEIGISEGAVTEVLKKAVQVEFFDCKLSERKVLTSFEIQNRYREGTRKRTVDYENLKYWLFPEKTGFPAEETKLLPEESTQSKVKESIVKKSKENPTGSAPAVAVPPRKLGKKDEQPELYWESLVKVWFDFSEKNLGEKPLFAGQDPKFFKNIVLKLKKRSANKQIEWSERTAPMRLENFLAAAFADEWQAKHFLLKQLDEKFESIVANKIAISKKVKESPPQQTADLQYLFDRFRENELDPRLIKKDHFDLLKLSATQQDKLDAVDIRKKNFIGSNKYNEIQLLAAYSRQDWAAQPICIADQPNLERIIHRIAVFRCFQTMASAGKTNVHEVEQ